jgi:hypothetical protein
MEFLTALRQDVESTVRPTRKEHGALSVVYAGTAIRSLVGEKGLNPHPHKKREDAAPRFVAVVRHPPVYGCVAFVQLPRPMPNGYLWIRTPS